MCMTVKNVRGQGVTEYIIIVALIIIAAVAVYRFCGQAIRGKASGIAMETSERPADTPVKNAESSADSAGDGHSKKKPDAKQNDNERQPASNLRW